MAITALRCSLLPSLGLLLPFGGVAAQASLVLPDHAAVVDGHQLVGVTFGARAFRTQLLIDATAIGPTGAILGGLRLRGDRTMAPLAAGSVPNVSVTVSHTSIATLSTSFASNVTGTTTTVFQGTVTLHAHSGASAGPLPWDLDLPFQLPFSFVGVQGNLLVEIVGNNLPCSGICNPIYWLDGACAGGTATPLGRAGSLANGDVPSLGATSAGSQDPRQLVIGNTIDFTTSLWLGPAPGLFAMALAALPAPVDLTPLGASGNQLWIDPIVAFPHAWIGGIGWQSTAPLAVPNQLALVGTVVYAQSALLDPAANALGLVLSAAVETRIGNGAEVLPVQMLEAADPTATVGNVLDGCALALRLDGLFF